jgi:23S rRNA (adenine2503-C2)-methyltransferase
MDFDIISAFPEELSQWLAANGFPAYRGLQLFQWLHRKGIDDPARMSNLPSALREQLNAAAPLMPACAGELFSAKDGTRKIEVRLRDGHQVETVLIPDGQTLTQCISSQVGCAVGCVFCRSGRFGLARNMTAAEIISQVFLARAFYLPGEQLRNIVLMGVGEPLHNFDAVVRAVQLLCHKDGLDLSSRRVTLSTVGIRRGIEKLGAATGGRIALAISLHASNDNVRRQLVPNVSASLSDIVQSLKAYPLPDRMRFTIEYVLVRGINDSEEDARQLVRLLAPLRAKVNLLPLNPHDMTDLLPPSPDQVLRFQNVLTSRGLSVFLRKKRGEDINAACGQLLALNDKKP